MPEETKEEKKVEDSKESETQSESGGEKVKEETKVEEKKEEKPEEKSAPTGKPSLPAGRYKDLIKQIEELSVKDLAELVKELEDRFGVSAMAPVAAVASSGAGTAEAAPAEEKTHFNITLADAGAQKIAVIKAVREIRPDLGLKEAKDLVDAAPKEVKANVPKTEAEEAKTKLETAGAKVELK